MRKNCGCSAIARHSSPNSIDVRVVVTRADTRRKRKHHCHRLCAIVRFRVRYRKSNVFFLLTKPIDFRCRTQIRSIALIFLAPAAEKARTRGSRMIRVNIMMRDASAVILTPHTSAAIEIVLIASVVHRHTNDGRPLAVFASREILYSCVT